MLLLFVYIPHADLCRTLGVVDVCAHSKDWRCSARVTLARSPCRTRVACVTRLWQRQSFLHTLLSKQKPKTIHPPPLLYMFCYPLAFSGGAECWCTAPRISRCTPLRMSCGMLEIVFELFFVPLLSFLRACTRLEVHGTRCFCWGLFLLIQPTGVVHGCINSVNGYHFSRMPCNVVSLLPSMHVLALFI